MEWPEPAVRRPFMIASQSSSACQAAQARAFKGVFFSGMIDKHIVMASQQCRPTRQHQLWHIVWLQGAAMQSWQPEG